MCASPTVLLPRALSLAYRENRAWTTKRTGKSMNHLVFMARNKCLLFDVQEGILMGGCQSQFGAPPHVVGILQVLVYGSNIP